MPKILARLLLGLALASFTAPPLTFAVGAMKVVNYFTKRA